MVYQFEFSPWRAAVGEPVTGRLVIRRGENCFDMREILRADVELSGSTRLYNFQVVSDFHPWEGERPIMDVAEAHLETYYRGVQRKDSFTWHTDQISEHSLEEEFFNRP